MDICQALYAYLKNDEVVSAEVGSRIYPEIMPEDCPLPAIVYAPVLCKYDSALTGDTGFVRQTIQIVCHGETFMKARLLSRKVKAALQDFHGDMEGLNIQATFIKTDYELNGNTALKFNTESYQSSLEFDFYFTEK